MVKKREDADTKRRSAIARCAAGGRPDREKLVSCLKQAGLSKAECGPAVAEVLNVSKEEAARMVHFSVAFAEVRKRDEAFLDAEHSIDEGPDED
jgi:hypothetical protein